mgnify:FL=1
MPNIKSAKKRVKVIEKKTLRNNMIKSGYKSAIKNFEQAIEAGNMDEAKKLIVLEQENEELKRELRELFKTLDQMNQSLNRMIDHYILCKTEKAG